MHAKNEKPDFSENVKNSDFRLGKPRFSRNRGYRKKNHAKIDENLYVFGNSDFKGFWMRLGRVLGEL